LLTEVNYVDHLMRLLGFSEGLVSVKATASEILERGIEFGDDLSEYDHK
ncbi:MAG: hypothetical protein H0X29_08215, partial [Parachlamydiaceae bacterium]|nr:hypothetical protein [Parachlamydiaceae bacterium]